MKILIVSYPPTLYGANRSLLALIIGLKCYKVEATVITTSKGIFTSELSKHSIEWKTIPFKPWVKHRWRSRNIVFKVFRDIEQVINGIYSIIANFVLICTNRKYFKSRKVDLIYTNTLISPFGWILSKYLNKPHIWHIREFLSLDYNLYPDFGFKILRMCLEKSYSIAISYAVTSHYFKTNSNSFKVVYNGVVNQDDIIFDDYQNNKTNTSPIYFSIVGLIHKSKGQEDALRAVQILKNEGLNLKLLVYGDGDTNFLFDLIEELNLQDNVEWKGYVNDPKEIYSNTNAVLVCSHFEAFGRVAVEAMAFGIPVIGYANAGTKEIIQDNVNGLLYHSNCLGLASKMKYLIDNPKLRESLVKNGKKKARQEFTIEKYVSTIHSVLKHQIQYES